ncbi:ZIP zinc/iron transport family [Aspergillus brunneoviolaceus CBS 621.78]|uniref:ZIP zinc/iron transport family n=1 Tax=Aspergillus brunneoviolaceus CBS 621.78 TaxID=1450534 RepID=A0ACD1G943_9EURO|nr:ZIP zinc/iron transport family [Aspergillus brunneoviolaceus CBS 621.78]RAH45806.1 ZIP zinc/iron transport family [Aspergillus brunneoviolaceus CBS 621.78]
MSFNPNDVDLDTADPVDVICYLNAAENEYNGHLGARISAIFVIFIVSTAVTFFPVIAKRVPRLHIPLYVYLFARYFGAGVIIATAFIHLLDPAYGEIGPQTCVGMTGHWADYSWCPAIVLSSLMCIFLLDFGAERYVEVKYGICREDPEPIMTSAADNSSVTKDAATSRRKNETDAESLTSSEAWIERSFKQQIAAFLILEFGVIFHSVIIGLNLGVVGDEFSTLYPVLVFHQSFEGLGIGARMSAIPFRKGSWLPWVLCALYGLTTPISVAIGLGLRTTYNSGSFTANVVSGVLDAISAGILIYTGLVELMARDFLFDPHRTQDNKRLTFMVLCMLFGAGIMALIGKWA